MSKGGYRGGSTIVTAWGSGWSRDARTPIKGAVNKVKPFDQIFAQYCSECGQSTLEGRRWPKMPPVVLHHFNGRELDAQAAVLISKEYLILLNTKNNNKHNGNKNISDRKFNAQEIEKFVNYIRSCAQADRESKPWPTASGKILAKLPENEAKLKEFVRNHSAFRKKIMENSVSLERAMKQYGAKLRKAAQSGRTIVPPPAILKNNFSADQLKDFLYKNYYMNKKDKY